MKVGSIPSSWMNITGVMSAAPNLALLEEAEADTQSIEPLENKFPRVAGQVRRAKEKK